MTLLVHRPNGEPLIRQGVGPERISGRWGAAHEGGSGNYPYDETLHFAERRQISGVALGTPGTLGAAASSYWGQIHVFKDMTIDFGHIHTQVDGAGGSMDGEVYRRRPGTSGAFTRIMTISLAGGLGNFGTGFALPLGADEASLERGDYVFMQMTAVQTGAPFGLLIDLHMTT